METFLLILSLILLAGVWSAHLGNRLGFPVLIGFVAIGMLLGPGGLRLGPHVPLSAAQSIGYLALILILFEGGLHTPFDRIRSVWKPALSLATAGVVISGAILTTMAHALLHLPWYAAALFGVAVSSTDAASVFAILGRQPLRRRLVDVLEVESGTNDPMAFFLTILLIQWSEHGIGRPWSALGYAISTFALQMAMGLIAGAVIGYLGSLANQRIKLDTGGLYPTLSLAFALLSYSVAVLLHGSGFLAVYTAAVVMGNRRLEHRHSILRFHEGLSWTMHIVMFVVLGLQISPARLGSILVPGVLLAAGALFLARPVAVWISTIGMRFSAAEKVFISWAGLRGAVPIVLVLTAMLSPAYTPAPMLDAVFFVVIASTIVQGLTVRPLAAKLDLLERAPSGDLLELVRIARENAVITPVEVDASSDLVGRKMIEIEFPENTLCYAIVRGDQVIVPRGATELQAGDHLLILSDRRNIRRLRRLFGAERMGPAEMLP
ncbi:potassium/proton antiporter [Alicyclobacillus acidocaldarius]|uniref:Sodium/hydrogen exchanger n=1 Tax=Alicyclobacillus acidocaldarius subsp. acidocaldarius (strain ATCC 27009 / DSM 446 / BCRC 14685 / JCM 5260 / KCTC 1825 / NBRC 15652 / NCIMB 11725 / NRRL B-14509 / 104-IA) TaxID=521098 RepID=C8WSC8_ALIAD|nr:potassium/proton antiporter [Alicyclobacillus acidocaldarius]ACV59413.1 sodium/hydrogen exchanger [Alicyclobacillus acidocaldarius subsp. acidocaldarius DSM 446]